MKRLPFTVVSAFSMLLCLAVSVLWVRSYFRVDVFAIPSTRLHRLVSGGGGFFYESLAFVREDGMWGQPSTPTVRRTVAYDAWEATQPQVALRRWATSSYAGRTRLAGASWGGDFNRAMPQADSVSFNRSQTFFTMGPSVTYRLVGPRIWIPYWLALVLTAALPAYWLTHRRPRPDEGVACRNCGYDLRASRDRCPECGTSIISA